MMQRTQQQTFTRDDAFKLTEKLIRKGTPNYIMRDALIERGISAYVANEVITEVRRVHLNEVYEEPRPTVTQLVMIVIAIIILVMVFFVLVNPVS